MSESWLGDGKVETIELCQVCLTRIETMCFKGTRICSENCRKERDVKASGT